MAEPNATSFSGADTQDLMPGRQVRILEVASTTVDKTAWVHIDVPRPAILMPASGARLVRYYAATPDEQTLNFGLQYNAFDGVCYMLRPGKWWVNVPTDGTPAVVNFALKDAQTVSVAGAIGAQTSTPGTAQTVTPAAPTVNADVDTASEALVATSATRKFMYFKNTSTGGQSISLAFGSDAAVSGSGITLAAGEAIYFEYADGFVDKAVNVIASAVNATVAIQTGG